MRNLIVAFALISLAFSCKNEEEELREKMVKVIKVMEEHKPSVSIFTNNEFRYPSEFGLFKNNPISRRIKLITGDRYDEIVDNFNVESRLGKQGDIYVSTGCKEHACTSVHTTIFWNSLNDELKVIYVNNGKEEIFKEK